MEKNASFWDVTEHDYDFVLNTNLKGPFFATQAFVKHLQGRKAPGKIINISSVHEDLPFPHFTAYCASKGGLKMMTRNLSIELAPFGITINNIAPGAIETPINTALLHDPAKLNALLANIPLNRLGKPSDVSLGRRFPRLVRCRLHHRHDAGHRRRADVELFGAVTSTPVALRPRRLPVCNPPREKNGFRVTATLFSSAYDRFLDNAFIYSWYVMFPLLLCSIASLADHS